MSQICSLQRKLWPTRITILNKSTKNNTESVSNSTTIRQKVSNPHLVKKRLGLKDRSSWPIHLIKLKHENDETYTGSKRCQSSIDIILASRQAWPKFLGEVSMFGGGEVSPQKVPMDKTLRRL